MATTRSAFRPEKLKARVSEKGRLPGAAAQAASGAAEAQNSIMSGGTPATTVMTVAADEGVNGPGRVGCGEGAREPAPPLPSPTFVATHYSNVEPALSKASKCAPPWLVRPMVHEESASFPGA